MSKGSRQRPTDHKKFSEQWDQIFGKPKNPNENDPATAFTRAINGPQDDQPATKQR